MNATIRFNLDIHYIYIYSKQIYAQNNYIEKEIKKKKTII